MAYDFNLGGSYNPTDSLNQFDSQLGNLGIVVEDKPRLGGIQQAVDSTSAPRVLPEENSSYMLNKYYSTPEVQSDADEDSEELSTQRDMMKVQSDSNITPTARQSDTYRSPITGYEYQPVDGSKGKLIASGMLGFIANYLAAGGDDSAQAVGAGAMGAYNMYQSQEDMAHRFGQVSYLENQGYSPVDINDYIKTGDRKSLVKNKKQWQAAGGGIIFNPETGESQQLAGANASQGKLQRIDLGDKVIMVDATGNQVGKAMPKTDLNRFSSFKGGIYDRQTGMPVSSGDGTEYDEDNMPKIKFTSGGKPQPSGFLKDTGETVFLTEAPGTFMTQSGKVIRGDQAQADIDFRDPTKAQKIDTATSATNDAVLAGLDAVNAQRTTLANLKASPGFSGAYGRYETIANNLGLYGQDTANAMAYREQFSGQNFLQARTQLKGQGAITDYESKKAEGAASIIGNPMSSESAVNKAIKDYNDVMDTAEKRLREKGANINTYGGAGPSVSAASVPSVQQAQKPSSSFGAKYNY